MRIDDVLIGSWDQLAPLRHPVMVLSLRGWFDVASAATNALDWLARDRVAPVIASIDPDPFYDFTQQRPEVELDEHDERRIRWPENEARAVRFPDGTRDLVLLTGVEPHLYWATFADALIEIARRTACEVVVTVGANAEAVPHTRTPAVVGSTTNADLAQRLGLSRPSYEGVTGVVGVLQERLDRHGLPAVSLRVGVPHYLGGAQHPASSAALLRHLEHVLGVSTGHAQLQGEIERWRDLHDQAVAEDAQVQGYVHLLEREYDRRAEAEIPSAEDLGEAFEQWLRDQRGDDP